ncbi:MAG TPA: penicillin-binding protein 2 [Candidatus Saccharimonadales bacterium]|nr:penicillin-binding protein 2 [Candidatus Saccharimonadales bacterium]
MPLKTNQVRLTPSNLRFDVFYGLLVLILVIFIVRLFYLQVIQHNHYRQAALHGQLKEYSIPAQRGSIKAHDGNNIVPIVLNEEVFTLFADPIYVKDKKAAAEKLSKLTGDDEVEYLKKMQRDTRYAILAKKLDENKKKAIEALDLKGIGLRPEAMRVYPQGSLAAQLLGFVNDAGYGVYGIEEFMDNSLRGRDGQLKAITDIRGVPLVANEDNVLKDPIPGKDILLSIDIGMQSKVEKLLAKHLPEVRAESGSVTVLDPNNGEIKAMANFPSYDPRKYTEVKEQALFTNPAVSSPLEVGSIMKTLTVAAGLDTGVIKPDTTFFDKAQFTVDGYTIRNVEEDGGPQTRSIADILQYSLNTGATYILQQMGGGEVNKKARDTWHDYLVNHYYFGQKTGVEQGYEAPGVVPGPTDGFAPSLKYANMAFGQGFTVTPLQMAAAFASTINGGTYYQPHLVDGGKNSEWIKNKNVIKPQVSKTLRTMHENSAQKRYPFILHDGYRIGGKTGTAQVPGPDGTYLEDVFNGTFIGYVGGNKPAYVIMVRVDKPRIYGYAGSVAAAPLFAKVSNMLIDNFSIPRAE